MVEEVRTIIFNDKELRKALNSYRRTKPDFLPPGTILFCKPEPPENLPLAGVEMKYGGVTHHLEFSVSKDDFMALLSNFCMENNITLPMRSKKIADFIESRAVLHVQFDVEVG